MDRIEEEIRKGIVLAIEQRAAAEVAVDEIRFSMYLGGEWHEAHFDREGQRVASGVKM